MAEFSPMMQHYLKIKEEYKDCLVLYRLGDFYELFFDDALTASRELEITLTGRDCGQENRAPMCGVPFHAAQNYIAKLITKGYKVAICEQLEDAKEAKGIVKRDVIRVVTPGTVIESNLLDDKQNNYIMSIFKQDIYFGISVCDISTGDFYATQIKETNNFTKLLDEIAKYMPAEIIVNSLMFATTEEIEIIKERFNVYISKYEDNKFKDDINSIVNKYILLNDNDNKIENAQDILLTISSINGLIEYLNDTQKVNLEHINKIKIYSNTKYMLLDISARRNLELTEKLRDKNKKGTLLWVLDKTVTAMGGRLLRRWINSPLVEVLEINERLNAVREFKEKIILRGDIREELKKVYDIERLVGKISYGNANARDLISLKNSLKQLPSIKNLIFNVDSSMVKDLYQNLDELKDVTELIENSIIDDPPLTIKEGGIIKLGYDREVDKLKLATTEGKKWLVSLEAQEREKTGIKNLKISFNKVFGYYIEVTKSYLKQVPDRFIRKQTLANCERYITEELKTLEEQILGAEEKIISIEYNIFIKIRDQISSQIKRIQKTASIISKLDIISSLAEVAEDQNYVMPIVDNSGEIDIKEGRHPVIEKILPSGAFVQNDTYLDVNDNRFSIITGPNMAGKSTYMRQVALITLMAQIGSFVPANYAKIGVVDQIFTRVGASDDLSMGQSTFMVEMMEVATILKKATSNSLIILDEIGRGTSTYDGMSIAWAVADYISNKEKCGAKTLFATHYHELIKLEEGLSGVKNYYVAVKEKGEEIIFLRKILRGGIDESYGIHVAKLAGVPDSVILKAHQILKGIERKAILSTKTAEKENKKVSTGQLDMYNYKLAELAHELDKINLNELTPINALNILVKMKEKLK